MGAKTGRPGRTLTEAAFQRQIITLARMLGWQEFHTHDSRRSAEGFPDLVLCHPRLKLVVVAELKVGANQPTAAQVRWLQMLAACGIPAYRWRPEDWAEIERVLRGRI